MAKSSKPGSGRSPLLIALAIGLVAIGIFYACRLLLGGPNIEALTDQALNGDSSDQQVFAAQQLSQIGEQALPGLRTVSQQSSNPDVVSVVILALSRERDYESMDLMLAKLDDSAVNVRSTAAKALTGMLGRDHHFPANANEKTRSRIRDKIIEDWNSYNGSELFEYNKKRFKDKN